MPPGFKLPSASAACIILSAARSLTDWPGFRNSAFPNISHPVSLDASFRRSNGVLPIRPKTDDAVTICLRVILYTANSLKIFRKIY